MVKHVIFIVLITSCICVAQRVNEEPRFVPKFRGIGPKGMDITDQTTCDEFSQNARFNPYSILNESFFTFYFWSSDISKMLMNFFIPTEKERRYLKYVLDNQVKEPINWTARHFIMKNLIDNDTYLLTERNDRGMYWLYTFCIIPTTEKMEATDVRFKQTSDNKYLGFMACERNEVYIMSRLKDLPQKHHIQDAAATLGYKSRKGKSYLYQGHDWMPIPEADDLEYWSKSRRNYVFNLS